MATLRPKSPGYSSSGWLWGALGIVAVGCFAIVLRVIDLDADGLWLDEGYSLLQSERSVVDILRLNRWDPHPPLYLITLRGWRGLVGTSELSVKALSVIFGLAGVVAVMAATRARFGARAALLAGMFMAVHPLHVAYSRESRGYAMVVAAVAVADLLFVRWQSDRSTRALLGWAAAAWVAVNTHYFAWYLIVVEVAAVLVSLHVRRLHKPLAVAFGAVVVASAQSLWALSVQLTEVRSFGWIGRPDVGALSETARAYALGSLGGATLVGLLLVVSCVSVRGGLGAIGLGWRARGVPLLQLGLPFVAFAASQTLPIYGDRYFLMCLVPLSILVGDGASCIARYAGPRLVAARVVTGLLMALVLAASTTGLRHNYEHEGWGAPWKERYRLVQQEYRPDDLVLYTGKRQFTPAVALHPPSMEEYLLPPSGSHILLHYTARAVWREPPTPGQYRRLWLVQKKRSEWRSLMKMPWFKRLRPVLEYRDPAGLLVRYRLTAEVDRAEGGTPSSQP